MTNGYLGLQITAESFCYLPCYPVLSKGGLNKNIQPHYEEKQGQKKPLQYFFKSPQRQSFKL